MYLDNGDVVLSPTDLTKHLACPHLTTLDLQAAHGTVQAPEQVDEALEIIFRMGLDHEAAFLDQLLAEGGNVVITDDKLDLADRVNTTRDAMKAGADVIYQATFLDNGERGHADFLLRAERPSALGSWSYLSLIHI